MWGLDEQEVGVQGFGAQRRNPLAELLMRQGSSNRPVEHWSQALANAASMIGGAYINKLDNDRSNAATASAESKFEKSFGLVPHLLGTAGRAPSPAAFPDASQQPIQPAVFDAGKSDYSQAMTDAASRYGIDPSYLVRTAQIESGGNPNARNRSGATGLFQFMPATAKEYGVNPLDPVSSIDGAARYAANAKQHLTQALGREPTLGELYLAHQQGPGGAARLLSNPNTPAASLVGVKAVTQNNGQADMTAGEFAQKWTGKFGQGGGALPGVQQVAQAAPSAPQGGGMSPRVMGMMRALQNPYLTPQTRALGMMMLKTEMEKASQDPNEGRLRELQVRQAEQNLSNAPLDTEGKALANERTRREMGQIGSTGDIREYEYAKSQGFQGTLPEYQQQLRKAGASSVTVGGGSDKQVFDAVATSADAARAAAAGMNSIREARAAVTGGGIFGAGADARLGLQKIGALVGVADPAKIQNTETFRSAIAPQVAALMKATVGSTQISNADREFAEKAAGGAISLDQGTIARLLDIMERGNAAVLQRHQGVLDRVYPGGQTFDRERALFGVDAPGAQGSAAPQQSEQGWREISPGVRVREVK